MKPTTQERITFIAGPAGKLEASIHIPENAQAIGILCHPHPQHEGTMHNKVITTIARACKDMSMGSIRFNYRGVGQSEGEYGQGQGETEDALAVLAWLKQHHPKTNYWFAGFSFGSYIAAQCVTQSAAQLLICLGPAVETFDFSSLTQFNCPCAIIQGLSDEVVSPDKALAWAKRITSPKTIIEMSDTSHFFHGKLVELRKHIVTLLKT